VFNSKASQGPWRSRLLRTPDNVAFIPWLRDRGSLTARIQARGRFAVRVLRQGFGLPTADEARLLGIEPGVRAWVREVALHCDEQRVVFAHTVLPYRPRGPLQLWLARLGSRSLGALLFSHPGFRRGKINYKRLDERHTLFASALGALQLEEVEAGRLWARRSHFRFGAQSVLVTEVFSPRMLQLRETNKKETHAAS
jgi:chorismate--pyruvate lyase